MEELHRAADRLAHESDILDQILDRIDGDCEDARELEIALSIAKRVRRESTLVVRALARLRDELQP